MLAILINSVDESSNLSSVKLTATRARLNQGFVPSSFALVPFS